MPLPPLKKNPANDVEWNSNGMDTNKVVRTGKDRRATLVHVPTPVVDPEKVILLWCGSTQHTAN